MCFHPIEFRIKGGYDGKRIPRYPLYYGSAEVEICGICRQWRLNVHSPNEWHDGPYEEAYRKAFDESDDW